MTKFKFLVAGVIAAGAMVVPMHAQADVDQAPNTMSFQEWYDTPGGEDRANVEAPETTTDPNGEIGCGCHGVRYGRKWLDKTKHVRKTIAYQGNDGNSSLITYRRYSGAFRVWSKAWCTEGICLPFSAH